ncbi:hypothetical protein [Leptospira interrogans]|uniref:hypothetical protein n=1 Tax=Leptospira interrogans TaxID=173 RepID=UPI001E52F377|nr:hypothetical protein [Leptospira interrogans]
MLDVVEFEKKALFSSARIKVRILTSLGSVCPPVTLEPWVANNALMGDLVHPNAIGLTVWGYHVSSKIKSVG